MGRIRILSDQVANQIAAGEVVERPASVVKELLENSLDAGATRIRIEVEAGGRKLIRIVDNGHGMGKDDALLAFERHATSKLRTSDDLLSIATLGFRGEALPSIASVARLSLETRAAEDDSGTHIEIAGGNILTVEDAGLPIGTTIAIRDLFFNTPARRKFLKSESTELSHIAALVTHYALAHFNRHFELHSTTQALLVAPAVASAGDRLFQIFGRDTAALMIPTTAEMDFTRAGLPEPPPWKRELDYEAPDPGFLRISGFVSKPELQKLNRNSVYVFVNQRLIRDRLVLHALTEAYRNIIPPSSFPVVLLFLEMPPHEVDVNVHPAKTEVRFRQPAFVHDFIRDTVRTTLMQARPAASFASALNGAPYNDAHSSLLIDVSPLPGAPSDPVFDPRRAPEGFPQSDHDPSHEDSAPFFLAPIPVPESPGRLDFSAAATLAVGYEQEAAHAPEQVDYGKDRVIENPSLYSLSTLKPLGQIRDSFILAVNDEGLWIVDQHVAHERILFEKILRERNTEQIQRQRLLMPLLIDLMPDQMVAFARIAEELERQGFEAEPFGPRTLAVKSAPVGLEGRELEQMIEDLLSVEDRIGQTENADTRARRIAASMACHAAVKINMPLERSKIDWLLAELGKTEYPTSCPHGRPIALRYSHKEIEKAFQRT
ncbi:DNA mismatch repair endonuclease MutL [Granulicella tundricola]|uniref:DNA mismatch repair protein MutL n=1 Tax=Granulicella tundricola (strain ATCC BAA-1859 / DSM 23138 / MP5ACTX9) TaxID=1198114 RepID=E8WXW8_GRATM|nr:DNA mismatch repair endonuclease MutL [Granulicella tundricola]ADW69813.1 DNA mismatch repair protein MutL [Granulicella tundricola MP5ACTX9]